MPEATPFQLRIYCLCGQKMKVSSDMLGKPGKCIACRQKIRIPTEDELGPDESVIHLKDHPEYLRRPNRISADPAALEDSLADFERDDVLLEGEGNSLSSVAFEHFGPIRRLCNYEHEVKRQLQCIREGRKADLDKATLMSYRGLARQSRQQLEAAIRDELIAIGAELQEIRESLGEEQRTLRAGDTDHVSYSKAVLPLRRRREVLVYRQHNLRGWLATEDPHVAGGLDDVDLADVPVDLAGHSFPLAEDIDGLPLENAVVHLERALRDRERADKLLDELRRMSLDGVVAVDELARRRADTEAERQRARTAIAFYRARLEQVIQDCEDDSSALQAYEDIMRGRLASAALSMDVFKKLEEAVFRDQVDVKRARNLANRALNANAVSDVPNPHGTFLERLARPGSIRGLGLDSWFAWAAGILLLLNLFVPVLSPGQGEAALNTRSISLFVLAACISLSAVVVIRLLRGALLNVLWLCLTIGGAVYLSNTAGAGGGTTTSPWWMSLGGMLGLTAWVFLAVAAIVSLFPLGPLRWAGGINVLAGVVIAVALASNFFGVFLPRPALGDVATTLDAFKGTYAIEIPVRNEGYGELRLGGRPREGETISRYVLEYKIGANSWADAGKPARITRGDREITAPVANGLALATGDEVVYHYELPPGIYRAQLLPNWPGAAPVRHTFQLETPDPAATQAADREIADPPPLPKRRRGDSVEVELRGVLDGNEAKPIFSLIIRDDGEERKKQFRLDDKIHGEWTISEYNPAHNTITVRNGEKLLIIERGKPVTLEQIQPASEE